MGKLKTWLNEIMQMAQSLYHTGNNAPGTSCQHKSALQQAFSALKQKCIEPEDLFRSKSCNTSLFYGHRECHIIMSRNQSRALVSRLQCLRIKGTASFRI